MPKIKKEAIVPTDGAILRALRSQSGLMAIQYAAEVESLTHKSVMPPHVSGYESGARYVPDWLIEASCRIFSRHLGKPIDPHLFPGYASRRITSEEVADPRALRKVTTYINRFAPERRRLIRLGTRAA